MIRKGTLLDFDELYLIYMHDAINQFLSFEKMSKKDFEPIFKELYQSGCLYIFEVRSQIASTCIVKRGVRRCYHVATIGTLATRFDLHGMGVSTKFMKELIQKLQQEKIKRIDLCVESDNPKAFKFYRKLGFEHEGILKKYYKREKESEYIDELLMALLLD